MEHTNNRDSKNTITALITLIGILTIWIIGISFLNNKKNKNLRNNKEQQYSPSISNKKEEIETKNKIEDTNITTGFIYFKNYKTEASLENFEETETYDTLHKFWEDIDKKSQFRAEWKYFEEVCIADCLQAEKDIHKQNFNNNEYSLQYKERDNTDKNTDITYIVKKNWGQVFEWKTEYLFSEPLKNFVVNQNWRWLSYEQARTYQENGKRKSEMGTNILVHNWKKLPYYDIIWLQNFDGKIFYFFKKTKNSKIEYYLDWKIYTTDFDDIIHNKCCSYAFFNENISQDGRITFWGIKDKKINYNEIIVPWFEKTKENLPKLKEKEALEEKE